MLSGGLFYRIAIGLFRGVFVGFCRALNERLERHEALNRIFFHGLLAKHAQLIMARWMRECPARICDAIGVFPGGLPKSAPCRLPHVRKRRSGEQRVGCQFRALGFGFPVGFQGGAHRKRRRRCRVDQILELADAIIKACFLRGDFRSGSFRFLCEIAFQRGEVGGFRL